MKMMTRLSQLMIFSTCVAEIAEFEETLKHYNATSRKLRRIAIMQEQNELRQGKITGYFEGTVQDRLDALRGQQRILENSEMIAVRKMGRFRRARFPQ